MKRMTVRFRYSNHILGLIFIVSLVYSCGTAKSTLIYETVYTGYSVEGVSSRAVTVVKDRVITGGQEGYISLNFLDSARREVNNFAHIKGAQDFRDVYYTALGTCLFMNSGDDGVIWKMSRRGEQIKVFDTSGVFLDGMDFWGEQGAGIAYGDPINGKFFLAKTEDNGESWFACTPKTFPPALANEGGFAASGSGIQTLGDSTVYFATGLGEVARLYCSADQGENWVVKDTPLRSGDESYGIYSMYFWSENEGVIVGGSYIDSTYNTNICQYTVDGGDSWKNGSKGLLGYCSCVDGTKDGKFLVATGRIGTFYSLNKGKTWNLLTNRPYYTCYVTEHEVVLSGRNGALEFINYTLN